jgi:hypothetical protein
MPLTDSDFPLYAVGSDIRCVSGETICTATSPALAADIAKRLNRDTGQEIADTNFDAADLLILERTISGPRRPPTGK